MRTSMSALLLSLVVAGAASAAPIVYQGVLSAGPPIAGVNNQTPSNSGNPVGATYYSFYSNGVTPIEIFGDRQAGFYDMSFWVFSGQFADTDDFLGGFSTDFDSGDPGYVGFFDDEDPANIAGPWADPHMFSTLLPAGVYTLAVTNFLSGAGGPPNPFTLTAIGVVPAPEPASMLAWSLIAGIGAVGYRLRKKKTPVA